MGCGLPNSEQFPALKPSQLVQTFSPNSCEGSTRFLNPSEEPKPQETELDRYFRLAFQAETAGNFLEAIAYYQKAYDLAPCDCDQQHALAGKQAAEKAKSLGDRYGAESKSTQYFWGRLQELTQTLPCVQIQP
ncbi:hypothetical protein GM3709_3917 (plasmid) [Geminocystis sp. NIES-3709]|nr:hypothetical protein GM3709_3917 [Geminocystis sp. NIES-3709]